MKKTPTLWDRLKMGLKLITLNDLPRWNGGVLGSRSFGRRQSVEADPYGSLVGWGFFATQKVARAVAQMEPQLFNLSPNGDIEEIFDHPILSALYRANSIMTKRDLLKVTTVLLYIWGSAPWYIEFAKDKKTILSIWALRPDLLKINQNPDNGAITSYEYKVGNKSQTFQKDEIILIREPNPANPIYGQSTLFSASLEIDADLASAVWNKHLIENGAEPTGVLETDGELDDDVYERLRGDWEARYGGPANAGKTAILEQGLKYTKISQSPAELDFINSRNFNRDTILTLLGIPTSLINDQANRANAETAERVFLRDTIDPIMRLITDSLSEFLLPRFGDTLWLSYETPYSDDPETKRLNSQASINLWKTPNEVRADWDLPALDGGDYIYGQFSQVPLIGDSLPDNFEELPPEEQAKAMKMYHAKLLKAGSPVQVKYRPGFTSKKHIKIKKAILGRTHIKRSIISDMSDRVTADITKALGSGKIKIKGLRSIEVKEAKLEEDPNGGLPEPVALERKAYLAKLPKLMKRFKTKIRKNFDSMEDEVMSNLNSAGDPKSIYTIETKEKKEIETKGWIEKVLFDSKKQISAIVKMTKPEYEANITEGGKDIAKLMGVPFEDLVATPATVSYLDDKPMKFGKLITDTTLQYLRDELKEGLSNGESLGEIGDRIASVFDEARGFRTETIARTEVGSALNFGRNGEMSAQGVEKKQWVAIFSNTRDDHADAHGQTVGIDEKFSVGDDELDYPQDPSGSPENVINCQCSSSPVF